MDFEKICEIHFEVFPCSFCEKNKDLEREIAWLTQSAHALLNNKETVMDSDDECEFHLEPIPCCFCKEENEEDDRRMEDEETAADICEFHMESLPCRFCKEEY